MSRANGLILATLAMVTLASGQTPYAQAKPGFPGAAKLRLQRNLVHSLALADTLVVTYLDGILPSGLLKYQGQQTSQWTSANKALTFAEENFHRKGGYYHLGPNDCSTFVCDFLSQFSTTISRRFTTDTLFSPAFMNNRGFVQVGDITRNLEEFDVLVYRYFDGDFQSQGGHCGIVVWKDGQLCIEHNSSSNKGLVCTPIEEFYRSVATRRDLRGPNVFRWAGARE